MWAETRARLAPLRARVTALATLVVLLVLVATSVGLVVAQRSVLTGTLEEGIETKAVDVAALVAQGEARTPLPGFGDDDAVVQVVDADGVVVASTTNLVGEPPVAPPPDGDRTWRTFDGLVVDGARFRVLSVRAADPSGAQVIVHVGASLGDVDDSTALLGRSLAIAVPLVTAVLAVLVWLLVGRTLRPVEAIRAEVAAIGGSDLHRRVPEPGTDDEIGRLARTMNAMLGRVERSVDRQQRFVADASHELRSPLTRMRAELEVDLSHPATADPHATHESVLDEVLGMQRLVDDLLLLARTDAGAPRRNDLVQLDELVHEAAARARSAGFSVDDALVQATTVQGDSAQLARALGNVVDNATRHGEQSITCSLRATDGLAELAIADDGLEVPADQREHIFERFARVDEARSSGAGGTGLGLAIARDIITAHGGTIGVDPTWSPGARIVVRLPTRPAP